MDEEYIDYVRGLNDEQIKFSLPPKAAKFFNDHPPLLHAWRLREIGEEGKAARVQTDYFYTLTPDQQYSIVIVASEMMTAIGSIKIAWASNKKTQVASKLSDSTRFSVYGANVHLNAKQFAVITRALKDQRTLILVELNGNAGLKDVYGAELALNEGAEQALNDQLRAIYPTLTVDKVRMHQ